jgi:CheY-like chemotaxis protein
MARILVIDDEDELRSMLRQMLEHAGHEVLEAINGAMGIEIYERDMPELIITDIIMPEKEGVETIIALRRADPALPIIAISGGGRLDATDFLTMATRRPPYPDQAVPARPAARSGQRVPGVRKLPVTRNRTGPDRYYPPSNPCSTLTALTPISATA